MKSEKGFSLIETLIGVGLLSFVGVGFLSAIDTGFRGIGKVEEFGVGESLVRTQLEDIKDSPYDDIAPIEYPVTADPPPGYSVSIEVQPNGDNTLQTITVTISRDGKGVLKLESLKVKQ